MHNRSLSLTTIDLLFVALVINLLLQVFTSTALLCFVHPISYIQMVIPCWNHHWRLFCGQPLQKQHDLLLLLVSVVALVGMPPKFRRCLSSTLAHKPQQTIGPVEARLLSVQGVLWSNFCVGIGAPALKVLHHILGILGKPCHVVLVVTHFTLMVKVGGASQKSPSVASAPPTRPFKPKLYTSTTGCTLWCR